MILTIYVPVPNRDAALLFWPKSAIVGNPAQARNGIVTCYFEGGTMTNITDYQSRLTTAPGRLVSKYGFCGFHCNIA